MRKLVGIAFFILGLIISESFAYKNPNSWQELFQDDIKTFKEYYNNEKETNELLDYLNSTAPIKLNQYVDLTAIYLENNILNIEVEVNVPLALFVLPEKDLDKGKYSGKLITRVETLHRIMNFVIPDKNDSPAFIPYIIPIYLALNKQVKLSLVEISDDDDDDEDEIYNPDETYNPDDSTYSHPVMVMTLLPNGKIEEMEYGERITEIIIKDEIKN